MKRISYPEFLEGVNFRHNLSYASVQRLMNSNAQTVIELSTIIGMFPHQFLLDHRHRDPPGPLFLP
jgi:hypothetical protein